MSVNIKCDSVVKRYGDLTIIPGLSLEIHEGEFFTLLGSSGCGKTTLLRMIAGFNSIEGGTISFNDRVINGIPPGRRNIGMVFQNYAIFPHMNVWKNVAFGFTDGNHHIPKEDIAPRVDRMLETVRIAEYRDRMPDQLSGGQQQRVALARAIVIEPDVLLMDEPLSNLDAKLRVEMRNAIRDIQKSVRITTLYVTHDQEEAMAVSDRIAIMNAGVIQQVGTPRSIYRRPANLFVATFIGHSSILDAELSGQGVTLEGYEIPIPSLKDKGALKDQGPGTVKLSIRPEDFFISDEGTGIPVTITSSVFLGFYTQNFALTPSGKEIEFIESSPAERELSRGDKVTLAVQGDKINVFNSEGTRNLRGDA